MTNNTQGWEGKGWLQNPFIPEAAKYIVNGLLNTIMEPWASQKQQKE